MNSQQQNYRNNAQSPIPVIYQPPSQAIQYVHQPPTNPVQYVQPSSYEQQYQQPQRPQQPQQQYQQVQYVQPNNQCQCNCHQQQSPNPVSQNQNRDIGDIVTSVIGEEKMKETMKDEEIKMLKLQLDILDGKLSEIVAKKVKKFCF
jgi:hypothetical protein